jgi:hypothetical protein
MTIFVNFFKAQMRFFKLSFLVVNLIPCHERNHAFDTMLRNRQSQMPYAQQN